MPENAHEFRLTPWSNDPVRDPGGEVYYLRDEESGYFWSPTPLPKRGTTPYVTRMGSVTAFLSIARTVLILNSGLCGSGCRGEICSAESAQ